MFIPATPTSLESENGTPNGVNNQNRTVYGKFMTNAARPPKISK